MAKSKIAEVRDMEGKAPLARYSFSNYAAVPTPYEGPGKKIRPVIKVIAIVYVLVFFVISTLILHEQSWREVLWESLPALFCLGWLWFTRTRHVDGSIPVVLTFYEDRFVLERPDRTILTPIRRKTERRREVYTVAYDQVTGIRFNEPTQCVFVDARTVSSRVYAYQHDSPVDRPSWVRDGDGAVRFFRQGIPPEDYQAIMELLTEKTGLTIES